MLLANQIPAAILKVSISNIVKYHLKFMKYEQGDEDNMDIHR